MPGNYRQRARRLLENLADDPFPTGAKELRDLPGRFRLRLDGWRIIYRVDEQTGSLLILAIRRKVSPETYQGLE
jgi:mRNA-degrading endonuclease RelE of RelBE toxin-antitoxin system